MIFNLCLSVALASHFTIRQLPIAEEYRLRRLNNAELQSEQRLTENWLRSRELKENDGDSFAGPDRDEVTSLQRVPLARHGTFPLDFLCPEGGPVASESLVFSTAEPVLSANECDSIIAEAEAAMRQGGESSFTLTDSNSDVHVRDLPKTRAWLSKNLRPRLQPIVEQCFLEAFRAPRSAVTTQPRLCVYDALVIRYDGSVRGEPQHQPTHSDFSLFSLNVALNERSEYGGGGTWFEWGISEEVEADTPSSAATATATSSSLPVCVPRGHALCHASALRHAGHGVHSGKRLILVLFLTVAHEPCCSPREEEQGRAAREGPPPHNCRASGDPATANVYTEASAAAHPLSREGQGPPDSQHQAGGGGDGDKEVSFTKEELELQSDVCHSRRCKRRGVDLSMRRFGGAHGGADGSAVGGGGEDEEESARGWLESALKEYEAALHFNPNDHELYHYAGISLWQLGRRNEARDAFFTAVVMNPRDKRPYNNLGVLALEEADRAAATAAAATTVVASAAVEEKRSGDDGQDGEQVHASGAAVDERREEEEEEEEETKHLRAALEWFRAAYAVDPTDADAALNIGVALLRLPESNVAAESRHREAAAEERRRPPKATSSRSSSALRDRSEVLAPELMAAAHARRALGRWARFPLNNAEAEEGTDEEEVAGGEAAALKHFESAALAHPKSARIAAALATLRR